MTDEARTADPGDGERGGIWEYVRRRNQLDQEIVAKFARPITIMFTDIRGSTTFFDTHGDLQGVAMLQRHNELLFPSIEKAGGRVLQRLGDGLLVTFPAPAPAVRAAIEIQRRLAEFNREHQESDQIHVRVGINAGMGLVEEGNVFGDAVNVAARVQSLAEPGQIVVSKSVHDEAVADLGADTFLPLGPAALKGKLESVVVFEVAWSPERPRRASTAAPGRSRGRLVALGVGAAAVIVAAVVVSWLLGTGKTTSGLDVANGHLKAGRLAEAAAAFGALVKTSPAYAYEGLARVALKQNDLERAGQLCTDALRLDPKRPGCMLVQGDLHLARANTRGAASAYEGVIALAGAPAADRAAAFNRLGRVAAEGGQLDQAATAYTKAREADPADWESLSNIGAILRRQGRNAEAAAAFEKAAALRPDDPLIRALLKEMREAEASAREGDRQQRVDALVKDLAQRYRSGEAVRPTASGDEWTSRPLTVSILGIQTSGGIPWREGESEFLAARLGQVLEAESRARLVERAVVDKLLEELRLSSSALVDRSTALRLGRLLSARLIALGSMTSSGNEWHLAVRIVETETSAITVSVAQSLPLTAAVGSSAEALGKDLAAKLRQTYPLQARIVGVGARGVILNIGTMAGARQGQRLRVLRDGAKGLTEAVGEIEIVEVESERSLAKPLGEPAAVVAGLRVREI